MQWLHDKKGKFTYKDKSIKQLHGKLNEVLQQSFTNEIIEEIPAKMLEYLRKDVFVFSGMKTYAELKEASQLLLTPEGKIKPFQQFREEAKKVHTTYNERYLEAEYRFATDSAQMAANWVNIDQNNDLQYRTAQDDRVRTDHAALANITLPATDKFWDKYYPPNGWNCRCVAVEVLPGKYERTDSETAEKLGETATTKLDKNGKNASEIFRFNPGKQGVIFPRKHPYYAQHCKGEKLSVTGLIGSTRIVLSNELNKCKWQKEIEKTATERREIAKERQELRKWAKNNLIKETFSNEKLHTEIKLNITGIKEFTNQPYEFEKDKTYILKNLKKIIKEAEYKGWRKNEENPMIARSHILEITVNKNKSWLVLRENKFGEIFLYSISDGEKILTGLKEK